MPMIQLFALSAASRALAGALLLILAVRCWRADNGDLSAWRWVVTAGVTLAAWNALGDLEAATDFWPGIHLRLLTIQWIWVPWLGVAGAVTHLLWSRRRRRRRR